MSNKADEVLTQAAQEKHFDRPYPSLQTATILDRGLSDWKKKIKLVTAFKFKASYTAFSSL